MHHSTISDNTAGIGGAGGGDGGGYAAEAGTVTMEDSRVTGNARATVRRGRSARTGRTPQRVSADRARGAAMVDRAGTAAACSPTKPR